MVKCTALCVQKGKNNTFTQGCETFKTSSLIRHEDSVDHKGSLEANILRQDMQSAINKVNNDQDKAVIKALKTVHWLATENMALSKYESLMNLLQLLSLPLTV